MKEFAIVITAVLPVLFTALAGMLMRRVNYLSEEADKSLLQVTINLLIPCFIFDKLLGNSALAVPSNLILAPLVGIVTVVAGILVGLALAGLSGLRDPLERKSFGFSAGIYNYGYVPLPLALALFDRETVAALVVHNIGVDFAFWTMGALVFAQRDQPIWRKLIRPPIFAIALTVILNFAGAADKVPEIVLGTARMIGACAIPMGLILTGAMTADLLKHFRSSGGGRVMFAACVIRMLLLPIGFLMLARFLPATIELKRVIVIQAAMPAAVFAILAARYFHGHPPTALRVVISTSILGFITLPIWIRFGMQFVGLEMP
ncbi:MAG: AEC family transporter [Verrucomicrobiae bacterium]|nr:AEC family transporter [Verrucomicrobiae bacterium]